MKRLLTYFILSVLTIGGLYPQTGVMRVEKPAERESDLYELVPCGDHGALLVYETIEILDVENKKWEFTWYDTNLVEQWVKDVPILFGTEFAGYELEEDKLVLFFLNTRKVKSTPENFSIISIDLETFEFNTIKGEMSNKSEAAGFIVVDDVAFAAVNADREDAELYLINMGDGSLQKNVLNVTDQNMIEHISYNEYDNTVDVLVSNYVSKRKMALVVFTVNTQGKIVGSYELADVEDSEGRYPNTARTFRDVANNLIVIGTYNTVPARIPGSEDYDKDQAAGMFMARFEGEVQQFIKYTNFLELNNLHTGLSRKEYYRVQRRSMKDGSEFSLNYSLLLHDIQKLDENYILLLESYYPDFKTVSDITYDYWGRPIPQTYTVFEGYRFISAIILSFSEEGDLLWDNSMEIYNISTFNLEKKVDYITDSTDVIMFFNEGGKVTYKAIDKDYSLTGLVHTELEKHYKGDKIQESGYDNMARWYDNNFICYGYQRIRNNSLVDKNKRTIFYFSKLKFE